MSRLINKSNKRVLSRELFISDSLKDKMTGLLDKKRTAVLIKTRFGIHTFGMKKVIDVIILDGSNRVVHLKENLMPGRVFFWNPRYLTVIEVASGIIAKSKTQIGDVLEITK